jgi:N-acetylneuraminic acid mutarotase
MRRGVTLASVALVGTAAAGGILVFGPPLPGPNVREWLGLANPPYLKPCTPRAYKVRSPSRPAPAPGAWRDEPAPPNARTELSGVAVDGVILTLAGQPPSRDVVAYDPRRRTYRRESRLPVALDHALVVEHGGSVYVIGGYLAPSGDDVAGEPTGRAWRYDRSADDWVELPSMRTPRGALSGAVVGDRIYAISGGPNPFPVDRPPLSAVEVFDIAEGRWLAAPPIPTPRHHASAATLGGDIYVAGGRRTGDYTVDAVERFDPVTNRWSAAPRLPLGVGDLRLVSVAGKIVAIGGDDETDWARGGGFVSAAVWALLPGASEWQRLPDLRRARHGFAAAALNERVFVFGGSPCPGHGFSRTAESLDVSG